jgi:hypothetical protein
MLRHSNTPRNIYKKNSHEKILIFLFLFFLFAIFHLSTLPVAAASSCVRAVASRRSRSRSGSDDKVETPGQHFFKDGSRLIGRIKTDNCTPFIGKVWLAGMACMAAERVKKRMADVNQSNDAAILVKKDEQNGQPVYLTCNFHFNSTKLILHQCFPLSCFLRPASRCGQ